MLLIENFIELFMESAPWLMLGLFIAGMMRAFLPSDLLAKHLGKPGLAGVIKAALIGAPLPLCSCGVIPAAVGLRRAGASKASTTSFLISTPETGVDSISVSYAMLGPFMAIVRPIAAITSAVTAGVLVGRDEEKKPAPKKACYCKKEVVVEEEVSCCSKKKAPQKVGSLMSKLKSGLRFTCIVLVNDITLWVMIGLVFAAVVKTYVPSEFLAQWGDGFLAFVVMALIGVPMYICATASTPIAAGLLFSGVSPGAVLVFMLVGPATNLATMGLVKVELGDRALVAYLTGVIGVGFAFGYLTNYIAQRGHIDVAAQVEHVHAMEMTVTHYSLSAVLAGLMLCSVVGKIRAHYN
ncbi:MAG: SO_0444 family Cu/Zn efflux transporter [Rubritalea sp.]|uniref:SO_0444 family Cu/Zn efflux transporter n=1 Tax=Rubritalea sp. TaxID=2109375 RepID=UPI003242BAA8